MISSALSNTVSGTVSRTRTLVIFRMTSLRLSRCWMLSVVQTSMPAASSSSMSCQRLGWRLPGPARQRRVQIELLHDLVAIDDRQARQNVEAFELAFGFAPARAAAGRR